MAPFWPKAGQAPEFMVVPRIFPRISSRRNDHPNVSAAIWSCRNDHRNVSAVVWSCRNGHPNVSAVVWSSRNGHLNVSAVIWSSRNGHLNASAVIWSSRSGYLNVSAVIWSYRNDHPNAWAVVRSGQDDRRNPWTDARNGRRTRPGSLLEELMAFHAGHCLRPLVSGSARAGWKPATQQTGKSAPRGRCQDAPHAARFSRAMMILPCGAPHGGGIENIPQRRPSLNQVPGFTLTRDPPS